MIRTCRLFFPVRNNYNVSLFTQHTCHQKQTSMEFSICAEQWKENYLQKKLNRQPKFEFSTFKEHEKIEPGKNQQKKSKRSAPSNYAAFKANRETEMRESSSSAEASEEINIDFSTFKENLMSKSDTNGLYVEPKTNSFFNASGSANTDQLQQHVLSSAIFSKQQKTYLRDAIKSLKILVKTGNRETANLKLFSDILVKNESSLSLPESCDVLYSFARLNFANLSILDKISNQILRVISEGEDEHSPKVLISLLQSVCKLKYRNTDLIHSLCDNIIRIQRSLNPEQTALCLFAISNVNIQSAHVDHFISVLSKCKNTDFNKTRNFLNYVWASVILEKQDSLPLEHLEVVLSKSFIEQLSISGDNNLLSKLKLANISGVALSLKNYKGPILDHLILSPIVSKSKNDFLATMRDSLSYIFPKAGFMEALSYAGSGVFIDIECCLDSSLNPVLLKNKEKNNKIGIVLLDHSDYCLKGATLTGICAFKLARIKSKGYKVLTVSHKEFPFNKPLSEKIAYHRNNFKKLLNSSK